METVPSSVVPVWLVFSLASITICQTDTRCELAYNYVYDVYDSAPAQTWSLTYGLPIVRWSHIIFPFQQQPSFFFFLFFLTV